MPKNKTTGFEPFRDEADILDWIIAVINDSVVEEDAASQRERAIALLEDWKESL